jgi:hypothetical protein
VTYSIELLLVEVTDVLHRAGRKLCQVFRKYALNAPIRVKGRVKQTHLNFHFTYRAVHFIVND